MKTSWPRFTTFQRKVKSIELTAAQFKVVQYDEYPHARFLTPLNQPVGSVRQARLHTPVHLHRQNCRRRLTILSASRAISDGFNSG